MTLPELWSFLKKPVHAKDLWNEIWTTPASLTKAAIVLALINECAAIVGVAIAAPGIFLVENRREAVLAMATVVLVAPFLGGMMGILIAALHNSAAHKRQLAQAVRRTCHCRNPDIVVPGLKAARPRREQNQDFYPAD